MVDFGSQHGAVLFELTARSDPPHAMTWLFPFQPHQATGGIVPHLAACLSLQQEVGTGVSSKRHCIAIVKKPDRLATYEFRHEFPPMTPPAIKEPAKDFTANREHH